ncbi:glycosyltransferase [Arthrobacter sp. 3Tela_A]|uniref:glycosyltransferase n=1 Tax=Arthrobacter sp. 3Tela_A TaxID=3093743 RepID=UPI003BB51EF8
MVEVFLYWMQSSVLEGQHKPVIISEYGVRRLALEQLAAEFDAQVIYTLHSNHLAAPHRYGSPVRLEMKDLLTRRSADNPLVVLTDEQRLDLWKLYGWDESIHVIPHYIHGVELERPRDPRKVVMVGRFHKIKGQAAAIRAFRRVVDAVPDAKLVFYGRGSEEAAMLRSIEELGITESVSIAGFTSNADEVFAGSAVSIVGSDYEGFCLSLAESMAQGCIPVSYDIKYGPGQLIDNGTNGFLVDYGNENELADAIILCLTDPVRQKAMSIDAVRIRETLSKERFIEEWRAVFETLSDPTRSSRRITSSV